MCYDNVFAFSGVRHGRPRSTGSELDLTGWLPAEVAARRYSVLKSGYLKPQLLK